MSSTLVRVLFVCVGFLYVWGFTMRVFLSRVVEREIQRSVSSFRAVCADLLSLFLSFSFLAMRSLTSPLRIFSSSFLRACRRYPRAG
jgi:hypothetical protein